MAEDEKAQAKQIMSAIFLGNNKKRKRGDVENFDDLDEAQKRKIRELERRAEALDDDECEDGGNEIEMQRKMQELQEEEEMSDEEIERQKEQYELYQ